MKNKYRISQSVSLAIVLSVLAGCSASGINNVSVEDRSIGGKGRITQSSGSEVEVTAFNVNPTFKAVDTQIENLNTTVNTQINTQVKAPEVASTAQKPATVALINTANYQSSQGSLRSAQSSLERALRISPKDPEVYQSLGEVHRQLGEFVQAEQMTLKGIALAAGQSNKLRRLWSALAKIRSESGDTAGANTAFQKSQSY